MAGIGRRTPPEGGFSAFRGYPPNSGWVKSAGLPYFPEPRPHLGGKNRVVGWGWRVRNGKTGGSGGGLGWYSVGVSPVEEVD